MIFNIHNNGNLSFMILYLLLQSIILSLVGEVDLPLFTAEKIFFLPATQLLVTDRL